MYIYYVDSGVVRKFHILLCKRWYRKADSEKSTTKFIRRIFLIFMLTISPVKTFGAVFIQSNGSGILRANMDNVANGVGRTILNFISPAGGRGYGMYCSHPGIQSYNFVRAFSILSNTVTVRNTVTGQSFEVPITCPSCSYTTSDGFLNTGNAQPYLQKHECFAGLTPFPFGATTSLQTTVYVSLQDARIPAGTYEGVIIGSVGELSESYAGEFINYATVLISKGMQSGTVGVLAMKFDVIVPEYTECISTGPVSIAHGSLAPSQADKNRRQQNFSIVCTGPANLKLALSDTRPKLGENVYSRLKLSFDGLNWLDEVNTVLNDRGTQIVYVQSVLEVDGTMHPQTFTGSSVIKMDYE
ncbi:hypothetical protein HIX98_004157 [Salmonella enterica subsp. enterica serovar Bredeney]|nr:hypothetical protein [Salmonella enterica subsp. enterica serovar Bredeney]EHS1318648.1 hypothetical protein [Salmonella enterica subsp. enterica serovar Reading]